MLSENIRKRKHLEIAKIPSRIKTDLNDDKEFDKKSDDMKENQADNPLHICVVGIWMI